MASPCPLCEAMAAEVAELRLALGLSGSMSRRRDIGRRFHLTAAQSAIAQALYEASGKIVPRHTLESIALTPAAYEGGSDALKVHVCRIRKQLGAAAIQTERGGYAMSPVGRALIYVSFRDAA